MDRTTEDHAMEVTSADEEDSVSLYFDVNQWLEAMRNDGQTQAAITKLA